MHEEEREERERKENNRREENDEVEAYAFGYKEEIKLEKRYLGYFSTREKAEKAKRDMIEQKLGIEEEFAIFQRMIPREMANQVLDKCELYNNKFVDKEGVLYMTERRVNVKRLKNKDKIRTRRRVVYPDN